MNRGQSVVFLLALTATAGLSSGAQVAELGVGQGKAAVVYPEHYLKDPGAGFPLVLLADVSQALPEIQTFADAYKEVVFVCAGTADRTQLLAELSKNPRLFAFPRGRIERDVRITDDGVMQTPTARSGAPLHYGTVVDEPPCRNTQPDTEGEGRDQARTDDARQSASNRRRLRDMAFRDVPRRRQSSRTSVGRLLQGVTFIRFQSCAK